MTRDEAVGYARDWAAQWNRRDLAAVLAHFADDVVFTSPRAAAVTHGARTSHPPTARGDRAVVRRPSAAR